MTENPTHARQAGRGRCRAQCAWTAVDADVQLGCLCAGCGDDPPR